MMVKSILQVGCFKNREKMEKSADVLVGFYPTIENADSDTRDCRGLQKNAEIETRRGQKTLARLLVVG